MYCYQQEGAGCIKVTPSLHTSMLESFKVHLAAMPAATTAVNTTKPKADPKGRLRQALKLPLSMVPKAADEAKDKSQKGKAGHHSPPPPPPRHPSDEHLSSSKSGSESSLAPKPYTPRLLQRLHVLQRRLSAHDISEEEGGAPGSPPGSPQPPIPESPAEGPVGSTATASTSGMSITPQDTPTVSAKISPMSSGQQSQASPTITTTPPPLGDEGRPPLPPATSGAGALAAAGAPSGTVIRMEDAAAPPPPPPPIKQTITVWQLLARKKYLMKRMTATSELPLEEDLLDRFSIIDLYSRRIFPTLFFILFSIYWILFNYYITDEFPSEKTEEITDGLVN